jgi:hypothetical protein
VVELADLAHGGAGGAEGRCAGEDGRREDHAKDDTTDDAPLEAGLGAVVRGLLDLELAFGVALDDENALDLDRRPVLDGLERFVGLLRGIGVAEVSDEKRIRPVGLDRTDRGDLGLVGRGWGLCVCHPGSPWVAWDAWEREASEVGWVPRRGVLIVPLHGFMNAA